MEANVKAKTNQEIKKTENFDGKFGGTKTNGINCNNMKIIY